jgi:hypothetical protein
VYYGACHHITLFEGFACIRLLKTGHRTSAI